ncbi:MAG TPA: hypothetical protein ENK57_08965 [Polyangiaceae bacterium]|nr:hypothetical protein [Polyangiaceae bacterium]
MINVYPWSVSVNAVRPRGIADTEVCYAAWVWGESLVGQGAGADLDTVELEDQAERYSLCDAEPCGRM